MWCERRQIHMTQRLILLTAVSLLLVACAAGANVGLDEQWGPLAVTDPDGGMDALMVGQLVVDDGCVLVSEAGEEVLVIWPQNQTGWDPAAETVLFERSDGTVLELRDGDLLELGGGGDNIYEAGGTPESLVDGVDWVSVPDDSCLRDVVWAISDVNLQTP